MRALVPIPHSPMTRSRWRARAVSSRSWRLDRRAAARGRPSRRPARSAARAARGRRRSGPARRADDVRDASSAGPAAVDARRAASRGPVDLLGREPERDRRGGRVEARRARRRRATPTPQLVALGRRSGTGASTTSGGSRDQAGSHVAVADEDAPGPAARRTRRTAAAPRSTSGSTGPDDEAGAAQPRLARRRGGERARVVARPQARRGRARRRAGRAGASAASRASARTRPAARARRRADCPAGEPAREHARPRRSSHGDATSTSSASSAGSGGVVAEQVGGHPVGHAQRAGEERPVGVLDEQQAVRRPAAPAGRAARARPRPVATAGRARTAPAPARRSPGGARRRRGGSRRAARSGGRGRGRARPGAARRRAGRARRRARGRAGGRAPGPPRRRRRAPRARAQRARPPRRPPSGTSGPPRPGEQPVDLRRRRCTGRGTGRPGSGSTARRRSTAARTRCLEQRQPARAGSASDGSDGPRRLRSAPVGAARLVAVVARPSPPAAALADAGRRTARLDDGRLLGADAHASVRAPASARQQLGRRACRLLAGPWRRRPAARRRRRSTRSRSTAPRRTGGPYGALVSTTIGAVTTTSSDGLSSPPSADQTSASERSCVGGWPTVDVHRQVGSASVPSSSSGLSIGLRRKQTSSDDSSRCSSSGRWVQAVTRYESLNRRGGWRRPVTVPSASRTSSQAGTRRWRSSRMSYR